MKVEVNCPLCGKAGHVSQKHVGKKARCPKCGNQFVLTAPAPAKPQPPPIPTPPPIVAELVQQPMPPAAATPRVAMPVVIAVDKPTEKPKGAFGSLFGGKTPETGLIESYSVVYKGGHPDYPKEKAGNIELKVFPDRFELLPCFATKGWFKGLLIPFAMTFGLEVVERQLGSVEGILGGINSRQLNQRNNIHITYQSEVGKQILLRLEMLSGVTVMGQAKKCQEFLDRLRTNGILEKLQPKPAMPAAAVADIPAQLEKLAALRDKGILSAEEFSQKKAELLARM
jgi:hypothetical protein